jgi:hypothetical protein
VRSKPRAFALSWLRGRQGTLGISIAMMLLVGAVQAGAAEGDPPVRVARLSQIGAQVSLEPAGTNQWTQALDNTPLTTGDRFYVDHEGRAELQMGELAVRAWRYTDLEITNLNDDATQLAIAQGSLHVRTFALHGQKPVEVDTPNGAITEMQPGDFRLDVYTNGGGTLVTVDAGAVQVNGPGLSKVLGAGESVHLVGSGPIQVLTQRMPGKDPFDAWSLQRDRAFLSSNARQYVNPGTIGSEDLDAFGTWSETLEYGPVWYPSNVPAGWSPYSNGRWTWIASWGWTWVGAEAWGFAPFHYGRWTDLGSRWGWIPGPAEVAPVYAPAMVAFVGGANFAAEGGSPLAGWIPLGAGEPFYPSYACSVSCFTAVNLTNVRDARSNSLHISPLNYSRYYLTQAGFHSVRYVNKKAAAIAVLSSDLASGKVVTPETVVHPTATQWTAARILSHPEVAPTVVSVVPPPVRTVPVPAERVRVIAAAHAPTVTKQLGAGGGSAPQPTQAGPEFYLIARVPPPAAAPTFEQQLVALAENRGRPLDFGQLKDLAAGRSAGPITVREFPPAPSASTRRTGRPTEVQ